MNPDTDLDRRRPIERGNGTLGCEGGANRVLRIVLACVLGAEEGEQPIAEVLSDRPLMGVNDRANGGVQRGERLAPFFGVKPLGERR